MFWRAVLFVLYLTVRKRGLEKNDRLQSSRCKNCNFDVLLLSYRYIFDRLAIEQQKRRAHLQEVEVAEPSCIPSFQEEPLGDRIE